MPRLTKPLLEAMQSALHVVLAGGHFDGGDLEGESPEHFERALEWVASEIARRKTNSAKRLA